MRSRVEESESVSPSREPLERLARREDLSPSAEGKSSLARLGIGVHVTAPTIHAGFRFKEGLPEKKLGSPIQLEIFNISGLPIVLDTGMFLMAD